jgi:O-antigen/teichoic acid export membrane protein
VSKSLAHRVFRGVEANLLAQIAVVAVNFIVTPQLVRGLGTGAYGLFTLMWTLQEYLLLSSLGSILGTKQFTARLVSTHEKARLGALLRALLVFHVVVGVAAMAVGYYTRNWFAYHLAESSSGLLGDAAWVFGCVAAGTPAYFIFNFTASIVYGQQRMRTLNALVSVHGLSMAIISAVLLHKGYGLAEIGIAYAWVQALFALFSAWLAREALFARGKAFSMKDLRDFIGFSLKGFLGQLATTLSVQGDRLLVGKLLALTQLGYYAIASSLAGKFNTFCHSVTVTVFPMFTELHATGQQARLRRFYLKTVQLSLFLLMPVAIMTFILAPQFLTLWLGADYSDAATWPLRLLVLSNFAFMGTQLPANLAAGKGHPQYAGTLQVGKSLLALALWPVLIPRYGILGAALGLLIAEWITAPLFLGYCNKRFLGLGWLEFSSALWRPAAAGGLLAAVGLLSHARIQTWGAFVLYGCAGMLFYFGVGSILLEREARGQFLDWLKEKFNRV